MQKTRKEKTVVAQGFSHDKACVLIALDAMFNSDYEGKDFLENLFQECWIDTGFDLEYLRLLEECAPVKVIQYGNFTSTYLQGDLYWSMIQRDKCVKYKLPYQREVILIYTDSTMDGFSHAVCIRAKNVNTYLERTKFVALILPTYGLIVEHM
mgnify:FL=1